jgi:drug/metabolite transporter (DMT)-like permease
MVLADAVVLNKFSPFFVMVFSALFLGERMKRLQAPALLLAILGVMLISRPRLDYSFLPAASALLSALFAGAAYTTLRHLRHTDTPPVVVFYLTMVACISMIPLMLLGHWRTPDLEDAAFILAMGFFALVGQHLMTSAYRHAEAGEVAIYGYSNVIFALVLGVTFWGEIPDALSLAGASAIIAGAYLNARSAMRGISNKLTGKHEIDPKPAT